MGSLDGKIALISGGAGAIGSATARRFLDEGAAVALADLDRDALERAARAVPAGDALEAVKKLREELAGQ